MRRIRFDPRLLAGVLMVAVVGAAEGQTPRPAAASCQAGRPPVASLGFDDIDCDCTFEMSVRDGQRNMLFRGEPRIGGVDPAGPAAGRLRDGDVIVAVAGRLITTREGGRLLANLRPNEPVTLTIRRDGRQQEVRVTPTAVCFEDSAWWRAPAAPPTPASPPMPSTAPAPRPLRGTPPVPSAPAVAPVPAVPLPAMFARAWFGFGINCSDCGWENDSRTEMALDRARAGLAEAQSKSGTDAADLERRRLEVVRLLAEAKAARRWRFDSPPEVYFVDRGSPAELAGLRRGDVLTEIDGVSLLTPEGGRRFGNVEPGDQVTWTYRRNSRTLTATMTAVERPTPTMTPAPTAAAAPQPARQHLRYSGTVAGAEVEVRGSRSVIVTVDERTGEVLIQTSDATIRLRERGRQ